MKLFIALLLLTVPVLSVVDASALGRRPAGEWAYFHFNGSAFVAGKPAEGEFVAVRDGVVPVVARRARDLDSAKLPPGAGAVAGICYVQSSGGKLGQGGGFHPVPRVPVRISDSDKVVADLETDSDGYFVATLPAGSYRVSARELVDIKVASGNTTLVPLRVGKRMVD